MPNYRPLTDIWAPGNGKGLFRDMWMLARAKLRGHDDGSKRTYYGAYMGGFPERARALLGVRVDEPVLHVCGGMAKYYSYKRAFGPNDATLDMDPDTNPDIVSDARKPWPVTPGSYKAILIDPPYSEEDAKHYAPGADAYPKPNLLLKNAFAVLDDHCRVGIIHYVVPKAPKNSQFVAMVGVMCGFNNRIRAYTVFEKLPKEGK